MPPNSPAFNPTAVRGRFLWQQDVQDLPYGFDVQSQIHYLSDRNFLEQYYKSEFDSGQNPATYLYAKQSPLEANWAWTGFTDAHIRSWINEPVWLPKINGYLIGQSFFDLFTYNTHGDIGWGQAADQH